MISTLINGIKIKATQQILNKKISQMKQFDFNDIISKKLRQRIKYSVFLLFLITTSCVTIYNKTSLQVDKIQKIDNSPIRLDGYFYTETPDSSVTPMVLYGNGYIHEIFSYKGISPHDSIKARLQSDKYFYPIDKKYGIWGWGIWWTQNDSIYIEQYCNYTGDYDIRYRKGIVTDDLTFIITHDSSTHQKPTVRLDRRIYKFQHLDSKPDSINYILNNIEKFGKQNAR